MGYRAIFATTALVVSVIGGAAFAEPLHQHEGKTGSSGGAGMMQDGGPGMMDMMKRMHGKMMEGAMIGGMGPMGGDMMQKLDANGDGTVTPDEMRTQLLVKLGEYDKDGDGNLTIAEFEVLHSAMIREMMVDKFQYFDRDGDGIITAEELTAPANKMEQMQKMRLKMEKMQGREKGHGTMKTDD